jgi:hypothetical protein
LGRSFVKRDVTLSVQGQILKSKSGEIIGTVDQREKFQDEVPENDLPELESSEYFFSVGKRRGHSNWSVLFEPLVAITVVSVIIYLFYTQRS